MQLLFITKHVYLTGVWFRVRIEEHTPISLDMLKKSLDRVFKFDELRTPRAIVKILGRTQIFS